jgi:hypothetical protein
VTYSSESEDWPEDVAFSEVAILAKEKNKLDLLPNQVPDEVNAESFDNTAMSIASLLNQIGE